MRYYVGNVSCSDELWHFGIKGMAWGRRRYQNEDGTYTAEGRARYGYGDGKRRGLFGMFGKKRPMSGMNSASNYGSSSGSRHDSSYSKTGGVTVDSTDMRDRARLGTMMVRPEDHSRIRESNARRAFDIFRQTQAAKDNQSGVSGGLYSRENNGFLGGSYGKSGGFSIRKPNEGKSGPVFGNSEREIRKRKRDKAIRSFTSAFERIGSKIGIKKAKSDPSTRVGYSSASKVVERFGGGSVSSDRGAGLSNSVNNWYRPGDSFLWDVRSNKR